MLFRRIDVYVPETHLEAVKTAMFAAGAGTLGLYECCCFQVAGEGEFRPLAGACPYLGRAGKTEKVREWKLEMICPAAKIRAVIAALRQAHPYETPAFQHWKVEIE